MTLSVTIGRDALSDALSTLALLVSPSDTIPILRHIVVEPGDGVIRIEASNLDQSATVALECQSEPFEPFAVEGRRLQAIVGNFAKGSSVRFEIADGFVKILCGRSRLTLPIMAVSDFPRIEFEPGMGEFTMPAGQMGEALSRIAYAHGNEIHRSYLCGAYVDYVDGNIHFVATNGRNFARVTTSVAPKGWYGKIWPTRFTEMLIKRLAGESPAVAELSKGLNLVRVTVGDWMLTSKLVGTDYVDYPRILRSAEMTESETIDVDARQLHGAVSRVCLVTDLKGVKAVRLDFDRDRITVTHGDKAGREGVEEVAAACSTENFIGYDSQYLLAALANCGEVASFAFRGPNEVATITNPAQPDFLALIYPYRL